MNTHSAKLPSFPQHGGCQCGQVRYSLNGKPITFYLCHCTECQRHTSSAFGQSLRVRSADLEITGKTAITTRSSASGTKREGVFCPECGVRLIHRSSNNPEFVNIKAGTLDDTTWLKPIGHLWMNSKQPWFEPKSGELVFDTQPTSYDELIAKWYAEYPEDYK